MWNRDDAHGRTILANTGRARCARPLHRHAGMLADLDRPWFEIPLALFIGAFVGTALAAISSIPFGSEGLLFSLAPGLAGGMVLGGLARHLPVSRWQRRVVLVLVGPFVVCLSEIVWLFVLQSSDRSGLIGANLGLNVFLGGIAAMVALPGTTLGAFVIEALVRAPDHAVAERARELKYRLSLERSAESSAIRALDDPSPHVRALAARWLSLRHWNGMEILRTWSLRASPAHVPSVARELVISRNDAAPIIEQILLDTLERGDWNAQRDAVRLLGDVGSVASLASLENLLAIGYHADEATRALGKIRHRLPTAEPGQLSFARIAETSGALSPSPGDGGLSLHAAEEQPVDALFVDEVVHDANRDAAGIAEDAAHRLRER